MSSDTTAERGGERGAVTARPIGAFVMTESGWCGACENEVHQENIEIRKVAGYPDRQHVTAWCVHCKTLIEFVRERNGGIWQRVSPIEPVTDEKRVAKFLKRTAGQRGEIQTAA